MKRLSLSLQITPLSWALRSIAQNEFYSSDYDNIISIGSANLRAGTFYLQVHAAADCVVTFKLFQL